MRYLVKVTIDGEVVGLLRLGDDWTEAVWTGQGWKPNEIVSRAMFQGDPLVDEITEAKARAEYPSAFKEKG